MRRRRVRPRHAKTAMKATMDAMAMPTRAPVESVQRSRPKLSHFLVAFGGWGERSRMDGGSKSSVVS